MHSSRYFRQNPGARRWRDHLSIITPTAAPSRPSSTSSSPLADYPQTQSSYYAHQAPTPPPPRTRRPYCSSDTLAPRTPPAILQPAANDDFKQAYKRIWGGVNFPRPRSLPRSPVDQREEAEIRRHIVYTPPFPLPEPLEKNRQEVQAWRTALHQIKYSDGQKPEALPQLAAEVAECHTVEDVRRIWQTLGPVSAKRNWAPIMLALLKAHHAQACLLLEASFALSKPPAFALTETIEYLYTYINKLPEREGHVLAEQLCDAVTGILRLDPENKHLLRDKDITIMEWRLRHNPHKIAALYAALRAAGADLHTYTIMHLASSIAGEPDLKRLALEAIAAGLDCAAALGPKDVDHHLLRKRWNSVFTTLLKANRPTVANPDTISPDEIWDFARAHGIEPNAIHLTAMVQNLFMEGRVEDAWNAFDKFYADDDIVDLKLGSTLLQGSKISGSMAHVLRALKLIGGAGTLDAQIANNILHTVLSLAMAEGPRRPSFAQLLRIYSRMFQPGPLLTLIPERLRDMVHGECLLEDTVLPVGFTSTVEALFAMWRDPCATSKNSITTSSNGSNDSYDSRSKSSISDDVARYNDGLLPPTDSTLEIMVLSWVCSLKKASRGPALSAFYGHFRTLLQVGDPVASTIVERRNTVIHDMIIKAISSSPASLRSALDVIADMLRDNPEEPPPVAHDAPSTPSDSGPAAEGRESGAPAPKERHNDHLPKLGQQRVHPRPSAWTWNILLDAWMRHHRQDGVGRIVSLMKSHGVEPSIVTWNTILSRAAAAQNTNLAVRSVEKMREAGLEPTEFTLRAFSRLREKENFLSEISGQEEGTQEGEGEGEGIAEEDEAWWEQEAEGRRAAEEEAWWSKDDGYMSRE